MNVTIECGMATLEDGTVVDLNTIQRLLSDSFADTGEPEYAFYADQLSLMTGIVFGAHGQVEARA